MDRMNLLVRARKIQKRLKLKYSYDIYNKLLIKYNLQ